MATPPRTTLTSTERANGLSLREANFLRLLLPEGATIAKGTSIGDALAKRGLVSTVKAGRWGITQKGRNAVSA